MKKALITGAAGFVGMHLTNQLILEGWDIAGYDLQKPLHSKIPCFTGDLYRGEGLLQALKEFQPDSIFHLAGVLKSEKPETFYNVHVLGSLALFEAVVNAGLHSRVVLASSSAVYGSGIGKRPITESFKVRPITHYAISKLTQEQLALRYFAAFRLPVICVRTFNLLGPGLSSDMAPSAFSRQIAQAEKIAKPATIFTGDLSAQRDYVDVRDVVRAYVLLAEHGKAGQIYNVCSGRVATIQSCLQVLLDQALIPIEVMLDPSLVQKQDIPIQVGSARKIQRETGWMPEIDLKQSLVDLLNDWRKK